MSSNRDASPAFQSFVFKLKYRGNSRDENRRYGFSGDLRQPAVFSGLYTRTIEVFKLSPGTFHLATTDRLGRQLQLKTYDQYLRDVCEPTLSFQNLRNVKLDPKGRIVLNFSVVLEPEPQRQTSRVGRVSTVKGLAGKAQQPESTFTPVVSVSTTAPLVDVSEPVPATSGPATGVLVDVGSPEAAPASEASVGSATPEAATPVVNPSTPTRGTSLEESDVVVPESSCPPAPPSVPLSALASRSATHTHHHHHHAHSHHRHSEPSASTGCRPSYNPYMSPLRLRHQHGTAASDEHEAGIKARVSDMIERPERRRQFHEQTLRGEVISVSSQQSASSDVSPSSSAPASAAAPAPGPIPVPVSVHDAGRGYSPSYVTDVPTESDQGEKEATPRPPSPPASPVAETWSGVKALVSSFVRDFNRHLAENMGDEFREFQLWTGETYRAGRRAESKSRKSDDEDVAAAHRAPEQTNEIKFIHKEVFCDVCLGTIMGVRHKCLDCSNYDLCDLCIKTRREQHDGTHIFGEIDRPGATAVVRETQKKIELEEKPVHTNVRCDPCGRVIVGVRHKCRDCRDYDMCETCIVNRKGLHSPWHGFSQIARPGAVPVVVAPKATSPIVDSSVRHPATCDVCQMAIVGVRYKCLECPDWDACSACHNSRQLKDVHPRHNLVPIYDPQLVTTRSSGSLGQAVHHGIQCDACETSPIVGVRYRCMHAECNTNNSFDLCAACEADPIARHPVDHPLLKIRVPATKDKAEIIREAIELARQHVPFGGSASTSTSTRTQSQSQLETPLPVAAIGKIVTTVLRKWGLDVADELPATLLDGPGPDQTLVVDVDLTGRETEKKENEVEVEKEQEKVAEGKTTSLAMSEVNMAGAYPVEMLVRAAEQEASTAPEEDVPDDVETGEVSADEVEEAPIVDAAAQEPKEAGQGVAPPTPATPDAILRASFVADVTLSDGSLVPSGAMFTKIWRVMNSGSVAWPESTRLVNVGGFSRMRVNTTTTSSSWEFHVPIAQPGEIVELSCELQAPEDEGRYMDHWRLVDSETRDSFGDRFWVAIVVESGGGSSELSGSSFIAPEPETEKASTVQMTEEGETDAETTTTTTTTTTTGSSVVSDELIDEEDDDEFVHAHVEEEEEEGSSDEEQSGEEISTHDEGDEEDFVVLSDSDDEWE